MKNSKYIASAALIIIGAVFVFKGAVEESQDITNIGVGGVFLGIIVLTFSTSNYIKYDAFKAMISPYFHLCKSLINSLELKSKAVYIPSYDNLPNGGVFIPLHETFDLDLAKIDENLFFITDVGREREMGLLLAPLGKDLMIMYEAYSEMDFTNSGLHAVENASPVLRSLGLASQVTVEERGEKIRVLIEGIKERMCLKSCEQIACPICSSILLSMAEGLRELIAVEYIKVQGETVEIIARKIGGVNKWM